MPKLLSALLALAAIVCASTVAAQSDQLPSWNDGPTKQSIVDFVTRVTKEGGPDYVAPEDRVATFDNDGTLWVEQPMYNQFVFAVDEGKRLPRWATRGCSKSSPPPIPA